MHVSLAVHGSFELPQQALLGTGALTTWHTAPEGTWRPRGNLEAPRSSEDRLGTISDTLGVLEVNPKASRLVFPRSVA